MDIDLDELRRVAEAATPGPWTWASDDDGTPLELLASDPYDPIVETDSGVYGPHGADATFIAAADPPTVLALIAEVERLRARRPVVCETCDGSGARCVGHTWPCDTAGITCPCPDCGQDNAGPGVRWEP